MIWREKRLLLIVLGGLFLANMIFFFTYRVQYETRLRELDARMDSVKSQLENAKRSRVAAEQQVAAYRKIDSDVQNIYTHKWATQNERLTSLISEVQRLAIESQLNPRTYSFSRIDKKTSGAPSTAASAATEVGISFNVEGTYQQVRRLINKLELSSQFVIVDQIGLSSESGQSLSMTIHVKTLFRDATAPRRAGTNQEM